MSRHLIEFVAYDRLSAPLPGHRRGKRSKACRSILWPCTTAQVAFGTNRLKHMGAEYRLVAMAVNTGERGSKHYYSRYERYR